MSDQDGPAGLGAIPTPLGTLEVNVLVAGLEAAVWLLLLLAAFSTLPEPPNDWTWWYAVAAILAVAGLFVLGLAIEGLAGLIETPLTRTKDPSTGKQTLRDWYRRATDYTDEGWIHAQRWIWNSPQAAAEFGRRRTRILVARNTAFNLPVFTLALLVYLFARRPPAWGWLALATLVTGTLLTRLFVYVWTDAHRAYHHSVKAADDAASDH